MIKDPSLWNSFAEFHLTWFDAAGDDLIGQELLPKLVNNLDMR